MIVRLASLLDNIARGLRAVLGAPDYEKYLKHVAEHHPGAVPMSAREFTRDRMESRYNKPGARCC